MAAPGTVFRVSTYIKCGCRKRNVLSELTFVRLSCRPHRVNHVTFFLIRRLFKETPLSQSLLCVVVFFTLLEETSFFFSLNQERCNSNGPAESLVN